MTTASTRRAVTPVRVRAIDGERLIEQPDRVVTEEPMEIRVHGAGQDAAPVAVVMRTPGHDFELAVGHCRTAGLLERASDVAEVRYCLAGEVGREQEYNVVTVATRHPIDMRHASRVGAASSGVSCGISGTIALAEVAITCDPVQPGPMIAASVLVTMPDTLRESRTGLARPGDLHAAGLFSPTGEPHVIREDVGRHNAIDKLIGHAVLHDLALSSSVLIVSGRLSFGIMQKAAVAGIPVVGSISTPSSLAGVATTDRFEQTLVGLLRDGRGNVYTRPERIDVEH